MIKGKQQYPMLDLAKFLCALLVLFYHYFSEYGSLPGIFEEALSSYAIAVALFMGISGFLTFSKLEGMQQRRDRWQVVWKQVCRMLRIYLLWSIVYILYTVSKWDFSTFTFGFFLSQLRQWIFISTFYTIWFIPALAFGLVLAFWVTELLPKYLGVILAVLLYALGALQLTYVGIGRTIPGFQNVIDFGNTWLGGPRGWLYYGFPMIMVGRHMAKYMAGKQEKGKWASWMALSVGVVLLMLVEALVLRHFYGSTGIDMTIMMPISIFCILGFLLRSHIPEGGYLIWMRRMSVLIFFTQRIFLTVLPTWIPGVVSGNMVGFLFVCGGTIAFSAGILALSKKVKWLRLLY